MENIFFGWKILVQFILALVMLPLLTYTVYIIYQRRRFSHIPSPPVTGFWTGHLNLLKDSQRGCTSSFHLVILEWCLKLNTDVIILFIYHKSVVVTLGSETTKMILSSTAHQKSQNLNKMLGFPCGERLLGNGLLTQLNYNLWKQRRARLNAALHRLYLRRLVPAVNDVVNSFSRRLRRFADSNMEVSLVVELQKVTLSIFLNAIYGLDIDVYDEDVEFIRHFEQVAEFIEKYRTDTLSSLLPQILRSISLDKDDILRLRQLSWQHIEQRRVELEIGTFTSQDLLTYMVEIAEVEGASMEDVADDFLTFLFSGYKPMARILSFLLVEVVKQPNIEEQLLGELHSVIGTKDNVEDDDLPKLKFLGEVLKETLRLHSVSRETMRKTKSDIAIGRYTIPSGTDVMVSFFGNSRHPEYWTRPNNFYPERFQNDDKHYNSYTPFSTGPRHCLGQYLAQMETKIVISKVIREFGITMASNQDEKPWQKQTFCEQDYLYGTFYSRNNML